MGTATVTVTPPLEEVERWFEQTERQTPQIVNAHFQGLAERGLAILREEAPKQTGQYVSQFGYTLFQSGPDTEVRYDLPEPLTTWLTQGTGIFGPRMQVIRPQRARALHFFYHGIEVFAAWVRGMPPNPFLDVARIRMFAELGVTSQRIGNAVIMHLMGEQ